jgi:peptidoglycan hydrolase-like protein with peptidoglycan-binding domain
VDLALENFEKRYELGGRPVVMDAQSYLWDKGLYRGKINGVYGDDMRQALRACISDPNC